MAELNPSEPEFDALSDELVARLKALPYPAYLTCVAEFLAGLRDFYGEQVSGPGAGIVERTIEVVGAAADGRAFDSEAVRLRRQWFEYRGHDEDDSEGNMVEVDLPTNVHLPAFAAALELTNPEWRYDAAEPIGDAVYRIALWSKAPGDNSRLLREFTARARDAADR